jgi:hypothetical protein
MVLTVLFVLYPLLSLHEETKESLIEKELLLDRFETELAGRDELERSIRVLLDNHRTTGYYLEGSSEAAIAASLQEKIGSVAEANQADLRSIQVLPVENENGMQRLTLGVSMAASITGLFHVLYALENDAPHTFIDNFQIQVQSTGSPQNSSERNDLLVRFEIYGFLSPESLGEAA